MAVEVTSSKVYRDTLLESGKVEENTFIQSFDDYVKGIEKEAKKREILKGAYLIYFPNPISNTKDRKYKKRLLSEILLYLEATSSEEYTKGTKLSINGKVVCEIKKVHNKREVIYPGWGGRAIFVNAPENDELILQLLQHAIDNKKNKLKKINEPKILLYYDTYGLSTTENYYRCVKKLNNVDFFHSVYVIIEGEKIIKVYE